MGCLSFEESSGPKSDSTQREQVDLSVEVRGVHSLAMRVCRKGSLWTISRMSIGTE